MYTLIMIIFSPPGCNLINVITVCVNGCVSASYFIYFDRLWAQLPGHIFLDRTNKICITFGLVPLLGGPKQLEDILTPRSRIDDGEDRFFLQLPLTQADFSLQHHLLPLGIHPPQFIQLIHQQLPISFNNNCASTLLTEMHTIFIPLYNNTVVIYSILHDNGNPPPHNTYHYRGEILFKDPLLSSDNPPPNYNIPLALSMKESTCTLCDLRLDIYVHLLMLET